MKFNKDKCKALHLGGHKQGAQRRLGSACLGSHLAKSDWGVFKMRLERVLDNLIQAPFPMKGWTR